VPGPTPEPDTVIHALVVVAVQAQVGCVVTVIEPDVPVAGAVTPEGESAKVHVGPDSVTVKGFPAIIRVAALDRVPGFAITLNVTVPDPVPVVLLEIVTQAALLDAVQLQVDDVAVTVTVPVPPLDGNVWLVGEIVKTHDVAGWVTVNVLPAMVIVPVRDVLPVFAATV
jgi:hypothetical protein